jgi:hypothetical protein
MAHPSRRRVTQYNLFTRFYWFRKHWQEDADLIARDAITNGRAKMRLLKGEIV